MSEKTPRALKTVRILAVIMIISAFLIIVISVSPAAGFKGKAQPGEPYSFEKDEEYYSDITDYAVSDGYLYVLYDRKNILKTYTAEGEYLSSMYFEQMRNGEAQLICTGQEIYLQTRESDRYLLEGGKVQTYTERPDNREERAALSKAALTDEQKRTTPDGVRYVLKWQSLYRTESGGEESCIIFRPFWLCTFAPELGIALVGLAMVLVSLCEVIEKKSKKQDTRKDTVAALMTCFIFAVIMLGLLKR